MTGRIDKRIKPSSLGKWRRARKQSKQESLRRWKVPNPNSSKSWALIPYLLVWVEVWFIWLRFVPAIETLWETEKLCWGEYTVYDHQKINKLVGQLVVVAIQKLHGFQITKKWTLLDIVTLQVNTIRMYKVRDEELHLGFAEFLSLLPHFTFIQCLPINLLVDRLTN